MCSGPLSCLLYVNGRRLAELGGSTAREEKAACLSPRSNLEQMQEQPMCVWTEWNWATLRREHW